MFSDLLIFCWLVWADITLEYKLKHFLSIFTAAGEKLFSSEMKIKGMRGEEKSHMRKI